MFRVHLRVLRNQMERVKRAEKRLKKGVEKGVEKVINNIPAVPERVKMVIEQMPHLPPLPISLSPRTRQVMEDQDILLNGFEYVRLRMSIYFYIEE